MCQFLAVYFNLLNKTHCLEIFLDLGLEEVEIPKDKKYLENILPELEELKRKAEEIINSYLEGVTETKIKEYIKSQVWINLLKQSSNILYLYLNKDFSYRY